MTEKAPIGSRESEVSTEVENNPESEAFLRERFNEASELLNHASELAADPIMEDQHIKTAGVPYAREINFNGTLEEYRHLGEELPDGEALDPDLTHLKRGDYFDIPMRNFASHMNGGQGKRETLSYEPDADRSQEIVGNPWFEMCKGIEQFAWLKDATFRKDNENFNSNQARSEENYPFIEYQAVEDKDAFSKMEGEFKKKFMETISGAPVESVRALVYRMRMDDISDVDKFTIWNRIKEGMGTEVDNETLTWLIALADTGKIADAEIAKGAWDILKSKGEVTEADLYAVASKLNHGGDYGTEIQDSYVAEEAATELLARFDEAERKYTDEGDEASEALLREWGYFEGDGKGTEGNRYLNHDGKRGIRVILQKTIERSEKARESKEESVEE